MIRHTKTVLRKMLRAVGYDIIPASPAQQFHSDAYVRHTARRLEHLASLGFPIAGWSVLEVGAGIGDHSSYYLDRGCRVTITEARNENVQYLRERYPNSDVRELDMENPSLKGSPSFDLVHCYGLLYHLKNPEQALEFLAQCTRKLLLLETCVSFGEGNDVNIVTEVRTDPTQACSGVGCRPTRTWVLSQLQARFKYVYIPKTQPNHEEFPIDWTAPDKHEAPFIRAVFIASRDKLDHPLLSASLLNQQVRHP